MKLKKIHFNLFFYYCLILSFFIDKRTHAYMRTEEGQREFEEMFPLFNKVNIILYLCLFLASLLFYKFVCTLFGLNFLSAPGLVVKGHDVLFEKKYRKYKIQLVKADTPFFPFVGLKITRRED